MKLVTNGRLITRNADAQGYYEHGAVAFEGTKIVEVGEEAMLRAKYPDAEIIDAKGGVIMPAFINAHTHIYSALARGLSIVGNNPTNFYEVLDGTWWAIDRHLMMDGTRASATALYMDSIKQGVTTIFDHHASYGEIPGTESSFPAALRAALPGCGQILIDNDSVAGWAGSLAAKPGINVVAGTGSVAYGRDPQRHGYRVGGWSLFFADEGSCSWVARQLITEFVKQSDGRRPRSAIYEEVRSALGITKDLYVSGYLQTEVRNNSALLAQLQPVALRAARRGDTSALDIYRRAAAELAETAVAIRCKLDFPVEVPVRVSYSGGLFHAGEIILQPFRKEMEQNGFTIEPPLYSPVIGATALAAERFISPAALDDLLANAAQAL